MACDEGSRAFGSQERRMLSPVWIVVLSAALLIPQLVDAADIGSLKNLRIGMSMYEVEHLQGDGFAAGDFECSDGPTTATCSSEWTTVAQIPALVSLYLVSIAKQPPSPLTSAERRMLSDEQILERRSATSKDLRIAAIRVVIESDEHDELVAAIRAKLGPPATASVDEYSNSFGAKVSGSNSHWERAQVAVDIAERCGQVDETCMYIQSAPLMKRYRGFEEPSAEQRQNDL